MAERVDDLKVVLMFLIAFVVDSTLGLARRVEHATIMDKVVTLGENVHT